MLLNQTTQSAVLRNFRAIFYGDLRSGANDNWWRELFMVIQSTTPTETFHMLRGQPQMREWVGDRQLKNLSEVSFTIEKKDWEVSLSVLREMIMFDRLNQVRPAIASLAQSYQIHLMQYAVDLMLGGFTQLAYDGQYFFDTDHDNGGGTAYSNKATTVFDATAWATAKARPASLRDAESLRYLGVRWTHMFYGVNSDAAVYTVFSAPQTGAGVTNIYYNQIPEGNRRMISELGSTGKWFLFDLSKPLKPFIMMIVKGIEFTAMDSPSDYNVWNKQEYVYGADSIDNATYGLWEVAYGSTNNE